MKATKLLLALVVFALATIPRVLPAAETTQSAKPAAPDAAWLAKAKADYPLTTCVVSGEEIGGSPGDGIDYVYRQAGRPDRLVRFCCKDCRKDFDQDPAKYLKRIDAAATKAKKS